MDVAVGVCDDLAAAADVVDDLEKRDRPGTEGGPAAMLRTVNACCWRPKRWPVLKPWVSTVMRECALRRSLARTGFLNL